MLLVAVINLIITIKFTSRNDVQATKKGISMKQLHTMQVKLKLDGGNGGGGGGVEPPEEK